MQLLKSNQTLQIYLLQQDGGTLKYPQVWAQAWVAWATIKGHVKRRKMGKIAGYLCYQEDYETLVADPA